MPDSATLYALRTPQGMLVPTRSGLSQPLSEEPMFDDDVTTMDEAETRIIASAGTP